MANIGKWYTFTEYYNEDGVQITKREAKKNYIIVKKHKKIEINGNTGKRTYWYECEKDKQLKIW